MGVLMLVDGIKDYQFIGSTQAQQLTFKFSEISTARPPKR